MIAELFVTQVHLALDDPDGPYTCGSPKEITEWLSPHIKGVAIRPADETRPHRYVIDLDDDSTVVVVLDELGDKTGRIGHLQDLHTPEQWSEESEAWVLIGGQPEAEQFLEVLSEVMALAPDPCHVVTSPRNVDAAQWAETMIQTQHGKHGPEARRAAHTSWTSARRHREEKFGLGQQD